MSSRSKISINTFLWTCCIDLKYYWFSIRTEIYSFGLFVICFVIKYNFFTMYGYCQKRGNFVFSCFVSLHEEEFVELYFTIFSLAFLFLEHCVYSIACLYFNGGKSESKNVRMPDDQVVLKMFSSRRKGIFCLSSFWHLLLSVFALLSISQFVYELSFHRFVICHVGKSPVGSSIFCVFPWTDQLSICVLYI